MVTATPATEPQVKRSRAQDVNPGTVFSRHSFGTVVGYRTDPFRVQRMIQLRNEAGFEWEVTGDVFEQECYTADQTEGEPQEVSRTTLIESVNNAPRTAMTVVYNKKAEPNEVAALLAKGQGTMTTREWRKLVKSALAGEERTMVGYHTGSYDEHGRLRFTEIGVGLRLVDPRTISKVIVKNETLIVK